MNEYICSSHAINLDQPSYFASAWRGNTLLDNDCFTLYLVAGNGGARWKNRKQPPSS